MTAAQRARPAPAPPAAPAGVREWFDARAADVDEGAHDTRAGLRWLGERGLVDGAIPTDPAGSLTTGARTVEEVAACCLSSGFSLWAHLMTVRYLESAPGTPFAAAHLPALRAGRQVGATALAPALRDVAGIEPVPVEARAVPGGLRLSGPVRWASNLFPGAVVVLPVRLSDAERAVVALTTDAPGVAVRPAPRLLALGGTASSSVALRDVHVPEGAVLSRDLPGFVHAIRPTFLLLQTAFCAGLAGAALGCVPDRLGGVNATLAAEADAVVAAHRSVRERLFALAAEPARAHPGELLRLRLDGAQAAQRATRLESTVCGGASYAWGSASNRRLREAAFLPVQSPTEGQLRWELAAHTAPPSD